MYFIIRLFMVYC